MGVMKLGKSNQERTAAGREKENMLTSHVHQTSLSLAVAHRFEGQCFLACAKEQKI